MGQADLGDFQEWFIKEVYRDQVRPALKRMTRELSALTMQHATAIGSFIDADTQLQTQRLYQDLAAQAHKDYHPSTSMCEFGTGVKSLAQAEHNTLLTKSALGQHQINRFTNAAGSSAALGTLGDKRGVAGTTSGRIHTFLNNFCNPDEMNRIAIDRQKQELGHSGMVDVVDAAGNPVIETTMTLTGLSFICPMTNRDTPIQSNDDINFTRTVMLPRTLDLDFMANELPDSAEDGRFSASYIEEAKPADGMAIFQMSSYLFGHDVSSPMTSNALKNPANYKEFMDKRSFAAKRSVATNSFDTIVALKTRSPSNEITAYGAADYEANQYKYAENLLRELGSSSADIAKYLGTKDGMKNLSYYAQMELLAKKIYQRPSFYVNLYDKPENVKRKQVAMQAVGLMLDREIHASHERSEAMLALLLETRAIRVRQEVQSKMDRLNEE